jgi:hypothetical protein
MKKQLKEENKKTEKGCTEPLFGKKSKCVIKIVLKEGIKKCQVHKLD